MLGGNIHLAREEIALGQVDSQRLGVENGGNAESFACAHATPSGVIVRQAVVF
jgi:hypothetical protein